MHNIYPETQERHVTAVKCECGGYCESVELQEDEKQHGCSRDRSGGYGCCVSAAVCAICKKRWVIKHFAPEIE